MEPFSPESADARVTALLQQGLDRHQAGALESAMAAYQRAIELRPDHPEALRLLGVLNYQLGRHGESVALLRRALAAAPDHLDAMCNLGLVLNATGDLTGAEAVLREAIALDPRMAEAHNTLGTVLLAAGDVKGAVSAYRQAADLAPGSVEALVNLSNALLVSGRPDLAVAPCEQALAANPRLPPAHAVMGNVRASLGEHEMATRHFRSACELAPDRAEYWCGLASSLESERRWDESSACFDRAVTLDPECGPAISGGLLLRKSLCRWDDLASWSRRFADGVRSGLEGLTPFIYLAEPSPASAELECARLWSRHIESRMAPLKRRLRLTHPRHRRDRITVGYFSHDFRRHPTAYTKVGLFENHDRSRFRVLGYCNGPDDGSDIRRRVIEAFDAFLDVRGWPPGDVARRIHADGVDILVDLKGHTLEAPTEVFALRPAPVQVNYKGYPGTIGGEFMDYIVADEFVVPEHQKDTCSEAVVYLPETYWVDDSRRATPAAPPSRAELGLGEDAVVFCGFNNSYKIGPEVFDDWAAILGEVPDSLLWLQNTNPGSSLSDNLRREAGRRGLEPRRLVFAPRLPLREYLGLFTVADLFLDTRPYNGHTTASDALWAGLPVLTLPGETFASRVAGSLLRTLGLEELVANSREAYRTTAIRLARDAGARKDLGRRLENARRCSPLYDTARLTRHMEAAYLEMYERFLAGKPPADFRVPRLAKPAE